MNEEIFTGDHAKVETIQAVTRQQRKLILESLPKQARDILNFNVRKFNGRNTTEAELWIKDIEDWLMMNELSLVSIFDLLLSEEAGILWKDFKIPNITDKEAKEWFSDTFTKKKSITDRICDLARVEQEKNERFATFEIRVKKLLDDIFDCGLSREEIVRNIVTNRVQNERLKENFVSNTKMSREEMRTMAKVFESNDITERNMRIEEIQAVDRRSYANAVRERNTQWEHKSKPKAIVQNSRVFEPDHQRHIAYQDKQFNSSKPISEEQRDRKANDYEERRNLPTVSMKHIARKLYNKCRGLPEPKEEKLKPGQCFCCGDSNHLRFQCPLKDRCLICGKSGHTFRECYLINNNYERKQHQVYCIHDEEQDDSEIMNEPLLHDVEYKKNQSDPVVHISSVGSSQ